MTNTRLRKELREMRKNRSRKDCYTLVPENLHLNPFMTKILRSNDFTPSAGVTHRDNVLLPNSPSCSGGDFKSPKSNLMSRAEFEMRTSLTVLKAMGPEPEKRKKNRVTQSMEINPHHRSGFSSAGKSFSHLSESRGSKLRNRLPKIKVLNKRSIADLCASL